MRTRALWTVFLLLGACAQGPRWQGEVVLAASEKLGGCAVGDVDPERPGNEIAAVAESGAVHVAFRDGDAWRSELAFRASGEMIQVAIGDADPGRPGEEIVAVGMAEGSEGSGGAGAAFVVYREDGGWRGEKIFEDRALIHGVCIAGGAAFVVGFSRAAHMLRRQGSTWNSEKVADLPGAGKTAVATDAGIAVACNDGSLVVVSEGPSGWSAKVLDKRDSGRARLGTDGTRIAVADDDGTLSVVGPSGREEAYREGAKLRGAVLADLDPERDGLELATAGYEKKVTLLHREDGRWEPTVLHEDSGRLHHLVAGELDARPGPELATCGYSGNVVVLRRAR